MIHFFRKIRYNLMEKNKTGKYLKYAIGEIVLVVVGILIALSINNWNEKRKNEEKLKNILEEIFDETATNIETTESIIKYYQRKDSLIKLVLNNKVSVESYEKSWQLYVLIRTSMPFTILDNGYHNLMKTSEDIPKKLEPSVKRMKNLYGFRNKEVIDLRNKLNQQVESYLDFLLLNHDWFSNNNFDGIGPNNKNIHFYLNDPIYKNLVYRYKIFAIQNLLKNIIKFHVEAKELNNEIYEILNNGNNQYKNNLLFETDNVNYQNLVGVYNGGWYGITDSFEIIIEDDKLFMIYEGGVSIPGNKHLIYYLSKDLFLNDYDSQLYSIKRTENGDVKSISYPDGTLEPLEYLKVK